MKVEIEPSDISECKADDRGRIYLGTGFANQKIEIAILGVQETDE